MFQTADRSLLLAGSFGRIPSLRLVAFSSGAHISVHPRPDQGRNLKKQEDGAQ
jgi:hypothetical protein